MFQLWCILFARYHPLVDGTAIKLSVYNARAFWPRVCARPRFLSTKPRKYIFFRETEDELPGNARSTSCQVPRGWVKLLWEPVTYVRGKMVFARLSPPRATNLPVVAWPVPSSASPLGCPPHPPTRRGFSALFILLLPCSGQRHTPSRGCRTKRRCFIYCNTRTITRETARKRSTPDNYFETKMAVCRVVFVE